MSLTRKDAIRELWARGSLSWKLHPVQKKMLASYISQNTEITTIACSRRLGKSFLLCLMASEKCIQAPNSIVKYVCPRKNMVKTIIQPIMNEIFKDCPPEMKPEFKYNDYMYAFPNGSQIQMAGTDGGHHENLRGGKSDMWIVDEAGYCDELKYVVHTILAPTSDTTGGRGIIASTPSKSTDHDFIEYFLRPADFKGELIKYTIYDNPLISKSKIQEIIDRYPSREKDPEFRREYLCEVINGGDLSIIPEFTEEIQEAIIKDIPRPPFYDAYVSLDIGFKDLTVVLFGYFDFKNGAIVIEDEISQDGKTLLMDVFAKNIRAKEESLWTSPLSGEFKPPHLRVADNNNLIMLNQLTYQHNIQFIPTAKDNKEAALNTLRMKIANKQIYINPRCKTLIYHLRNGSWAKNRKEYARSPDAGHYDAIDSLVYFVRNVQETKNPYPAGYGFISREQFFKPEDKKVYTKQQENWVNMFKPRTSLKFKK
jgi:Terminase large subunit, T4likevirus-type, N-terminal